MKYTYYISFWAKKGDGPAIIMAKYVYTLWPINTVERMEEIAGFLLYENGLDSITINNIIFLEEKENGA